MVRFSVYPHGSTIPANLYFTCHVMADSIYMAGYPALKKNKFKAKFSRIAIHFNRGKIRKIFKTGHSWLTNRKFDLNYLYDQRQYSMFL